MNKLFILAFASMRKAKRQMVILALLFVISSMLLNTSLIILLDFNDSFDQAAAELKTSDLFFVIPNQDDSYTDDLKQYFLNHEDIESFQMNTGIMANISQPKDATILGIIANRDEPRMISEWRVIGESISEVENAIYVPYHFKVGEGLQLGDEFILEIEDGIHHFNIAGFSETIFQSAARIENVFFVPNERFYKLSEELADFRYTMVFANGIEDYAMLEVELMDLLSITNSLGITGGVGGLFGVNYASIREGRTMMPSAIAAMLMVFTGIVATVCLLVIHFKIKENIEEDMPQLGLLQSLGYTSRQLMLAITAQYTMIAALSCLLGIVPAYFISPIIGDILAQQSSFFWNPNFSLMISLIVVMALSGIVIMVSYLTSAKIRKISAIEALRTGIKTHNFKRNYLPLEHLKLPLSLTLSLKSVLQDTRKSISMLMIVTSMSFVATMAAILYYNSTVDISTFEVTPGIERANAAIVFEPSSDEEMLALKEEILAHPDVYHAQYLDSGRLIIEDIVVGAMIMQDYSRRVTNNVYEGIFPRYYNEITLSGVLANRLDKSVGDIVLVGEEELPFLITGLSQGMETGGIYAVYITLDGMRRIQPFFTQMSLMIYVNAEVDVPEFVGELEIQFEGRSLFVQDADALFAEGMGPFATIISRVGIAMATLSAFIIVLVLYFVIGSAITRKRRELGIQKAMGYTTISQMIQVTLTFTLPLILGVVIGCVIGVFITDPLMSIGMQAAGVMQSQQIINPIWIIAVGICIIFLSHLSSMLMTWRIRKISAYELISE